MKKNSLRALTVYLLLFAVGTGCTHVRPVSFTNPQLGGGAPAVPIRVALVIDPSAADFHHKFSLMGDTFDYDFGSSIRKYVRNVAESIFVSVKEFPTSSAAANQADAVVVVDSPKAEHTLPVFAWQKRTFILRINWTVNNRGGQSPLWVKTMEGTAEHNVGNAFTMASNERKLFQDLLTDLSVKTSRALRDSPELKQIRQQP